MSLSHPARFYLVGSMNPEEGKLRPQFLDRFGLYVTVKGSADCRERAEIIRRKLEYDRDPVGYCLLWKEQQEELRQKIRKARSALGQVVVTEAALRLAATISAEANCAGQRAEIVITETARAIAALEGRTVLNQQDIRTAAEYALPHRMRQGQQEQSVEDMEDDCRQPEDENREPESEQPEAPSEEPEENGTGETEEPDGQPSESERQDAGEQMDDDFEFSEETAQKDQADTADPFTEDSEESRVIREEIQETGRVFQVIPWLADIQNKTVRMGSGRRSLVKTSAMQGRYVKAVLPSGEIRDIAFDATLRAAAPYQKLREKNGMALALEKEDIRVKIREKRAGNTILFVVDASGSMGANQRMRAVKGAICSLLNDAYQKRDQVGMIAFRKHSAELLLGITRSVELAQKKLEVLPTGGRTPLGAGLALAREVLKAQQLKDKDCIPVLVLLSDGRANAAAGGGHPVREAMEQAEKIRADGFQCIVIDTEKDFIRLRLAEELAEKMQADYFKIEDLDAGTIREIVSNNRAVI